MDNQNIPRRIREIREQHALSQQELADLMGWKSHASIVAIENGEKNVKIQELLKLSSILSTPLESFFSETSSTSERPTILWRKKAADSKIVLREEYNLIEYYKNYQLVERLSQTKSLSTKYLPKKTFDIHSDQYKWVNQLAESIHKDFHLGDYPAESLIKCLEEEYGVLLISRPLEEGSAACYRDESGSVIILNEKEVRWRQIFSLAHELFHLITWNEELISKIQSDETLFNKNESLADAFAAALLMPQTMINHDVSESKLTYSFIIALAGKYQVSKQAMLWRLHHLRFITKEEVQLALKDPEFLKFDHEISKQVFTATSSLGNRFIRLAYLSYENGKLSKTKFARILKVKLRDLEQYLAEKGLFLTDDKEIRRAC